MSKNIYLEAMEIFHAAADLIGLDHRIRRELEEPDYEHIFYVTADLEDRLVPLPESEAAQYSKLGASTVMAEHLLRYLAPQLETATPEPPTALALR